MKKTLSLKNTVSAAMKFRKKNHTYFGIFMIVISRMYRTEVVG